MRTPEIHLKTCQTSIRSGHRTAPIRDQVGGFGYRFDRMFESRGNMQACRNIDQTCWRSMVLFISRPSSWYNWCVVIVASLIYRIRYLEMRRRSSLQLFGWVVPILCLNFHNSSRIRWSKLRLQCGVCSNRSFASLRRYCHRRLHRYTCPWSICHSMKPILQHSYPNLLARFFRTRVFHISHPQSPRQRTNSTAASDIDHPTHSPC